MTDISSLGFSVDTRQLKRIGPAHVHREMKCLLGLMDRIKRLPASEQIALIRAHVSATAQDAALEVSSGQPR